MKANVRRAPVGKGPFHGCPLRLTIGIIVKNGEKTLDKCLESVQPLLDAVPSELIVTDTGSTDRTVEIAKRYTDQIIPFEWCGDFAAARNTGLEAARGEWFLFLDADEWFEDVSELIAFFSGTECDRYGSGSYIVRNYTDFDGKNYTDFHATRIFRRYPGIKFEHAVHEAVKWLKPIRFFSAYVHHYGYVFHSPEERKKKLNRNLGMLEKELEKTPDDVKYLYQIARQYFALNQYDKIIECCKRGLEAEQKHPQREWKLSFYSVLVTAYCNSKRYREAIAAVEECVASDKATELPYIDYYYVETLSHYALEEYEETINDAEKYFEAYELYKEGKLNEEYLLYGNDIGIRPVSRAQVLSVLARANVALEKYEQAAHEFSKIDFSAADVIGQKMSVLCLILAEKTENYALLPEFYKRILAAKDLAKKQNFISACEAYLRQRPEQRENVLSAFANSDLTDNYAVMNRMRASASDREKIQKLLGMLTPDAMGWSADYSDVVYLAMKSGADFSPLFDVIDRDAVPGLALGAEREHSDAEEVFYDTFSRRSFSGLKGLFWRICFEERVLLNDRNFSVRERLEYFRKYVGDLDEYGRKIYRNGLFSEADASLLPRRVRFGWHMKRAFELQTGDGAGYVRELRAALECFPAMKKPIEALLKKFESESKENRKRFEEFNGLAAKVKDQIENLIECGRLEEAGRVTVSLAKLMPEDADVLRFQKLTNTEPSMREIASKIPQ